MKIKFKLLFAVALFTTLTKFSLAIQPSENALSLNTIATTGHAEVNLVQTIAIINLTITKTDNNAKAAQIAVRSEADNLVQKLKATNPLSLSTIGVSVNPVMSYKDSTSKIVGYTATYAVEVKVKIADAGKTMDIAMDNGVNVVNSPQLSASDDAKSKAQLDAIKLATINAKSQAEASLSALGLKSNGIKQITILPQNPQPTPQPRMMAMMSNGSNALPNTPIEAGVDVVSADVNVLVGY
jgi:uncharacterized protein YggE